LASTWPLEVGQEVVVRRCRKADGLAIRGLGACGVDGVERVRDQDGGPAGASADEAPGRDRGQEQPLVRAAQHHDLGLWIERARETVAAAKPVGRGAAEPLRALAGGVAAELAKMRGDNRADEGRNRVLRLADGEVDRRLAGLDPGEQIRKPRERRALIGAANGGGAEFRIGNGHGRRDGGGQIQPAMNSIAAPRLRAV
jgi:hypothetical protein